MTTDAITGPQRVITLIEVHDALSKKLDDNDRRSAERDRLIIDEMEQVKAQLVHHDRRIGVLERGSPAALARPLWVIAILVAAAVAAMWRH